MHFMPSPLEPRSELCHMRRHSADGDRMQRFPGQESYAQRAASIERSAVAGAETCKSWRG
eukprot:1234887-Rhodomonas_salina.6